MRRRRRSLEWIGPSRGHVAGPPAINPSIMRFLSAPGPPSLAKLPAIAIAAAATLAAARAAARCSCEMPAVVACGGDHGRRQGRVREPCESARALIAPCRSIGGAWRRVSVRDRTYPRTRTRTHARLHALALERRQKWILPRPAAAAATALAAASSFPCWSILQQQPRRVSACVLDRECGGDAVFLLPVRQHEGPLVGRGVLPADGAAGYGQVVHEAGLAHACAGFEIRI